MPVTFPSLLVFEIFAPLVLRLALAAFFFVTASEHLPKGVRVKTEKALAKTLPKTAGLLVWYTGLIELALGTLFLVGLFTQIAGILAAIYAVKFTVFEEQKTRFSVLVRHERLIYIFIFAAGVSLAFLGAGAFALDLPL